ncbi:MAG: DUF4878 domain-containing protein [Zoogloeaceae bacterium]|jgi:uncharacterized membrane protein YvbJ|nr:DUF4878 domain-containing protein [Zoogloeaceae bacterium]
MSTRSLAFFPRFFMLCLLGVFLVACGSSSSPEGTVNDYFKAVVDNRVEDAVAFYSIKDVKDNDLTMVKGKLQMIVGEQISKMQKSGGLQTLTTKTVSAEGDTATVEVEITYGNGKKESETLKLGKEEGGWKILLN